MKKNKKLLTLAIVGMLLAGGGAINNNSNKINAEEPDQGVLALFNDYYNSGSYRRDTTINFNKENGAYDVAVYFHAKADDLERTTYFNGDELWMTNSSGVNSGYGTNGNNMTHFRKDLQTGENVSVYTAVKNTTMEDYYQTLFDFSSATYDGEWTLNNNVYASNDKTLINQFGLFTAPCFLGFEGDTENLLTFSHVEVEEVNETLEMRLYVKEDSKGWLQDQEELLFSKAVITKGGEIEKVTPTVTYNFEAGTTFTNEYLKENIKSLFSVSPIDTMYTWYLEDGEGVNHGQEIPNSGRYSLIVEINENFKQESVRKWCSMKIKQEVIINFNNAAVYDYTGQPVSPEFTGFTDARGNEVEIPSTEYTIRYTSEAGYDSEVAPTEPGTYSMTVRINENSSFTSKYDAEAGIKHWAVFRINEPVEEDKTLVTINFSDETRFEYDGMRHSPTVVNFTDEEGNVVDVPKEAYSIHYDANGVILYEAPYEAGWYSIVVTMNEEYNYVAKVDPDNGINKHLPFQIFEPEVTVTCSGLPNIYLDNSLENIIDGSLDTYAWFEGTPDVSNNPEIVVDLGRVKTIKEIVLHNGNASLGDLADMDVYASSNGVDYELVGFMRVGEEGHTKTISMSNGYINARYIKLDGIDTGGHWFAFREIEFVYSEKVLSYENIDGLFVYGEYKNAFDGDEETYAWFDYNSKEGGASFVLDLMSIKEINNIDVIMGQHDEHGDFLHNYEILVSEDGNEWVSIGEYTDTRVLRLTLESTITARYVKIQALSLDTGCNIVIREISAY
ncbi:MAG: discoidin domain-containing protein [Erysipelotrichaceae bacterium]|nr:discoidin domain-containing protein [Erysipelotrichaceae bacterium]